MKSQVSERLKEPVAKEVLELIFQPRLDHDFALNFAPITLINRAHVVMLRRQGIITAEVAKALLNAFSTMEKAGAASYPPDPRLEDPYFNYEAVVISLIGADAGGRMHIARSRNDLGATLQRLHCRDIALDLTDALHRLIEVLIKRADQFADVVMPGYTHMQPAQPSTYGFYLLGIADAFMRDSDRMDAVWPRINLNPMGAAAMTGTSFPIDRDLTTSLLGFDALIEHTQDSVASRDYALELLGVCVQMAVTWSRLAQDFYVMVCTVPDAGAAGPCRRYVQHHAAEKEPGGDGASEGKKRAGARCLCVSGGGDAGDQLLQHHRRQPRGSGAGLGGIRADRWLPEDRHADGGRGAAEPRAHAASGRAQLLHCDRSGGCDGAAGRAVVPRRASCGWRRGAHGDGSGIRRQSDHHVDGR